MSLLMFEHDVDSVSIITDTLATVPGGDPLMFQSKAWALPHLNMAIAVTGVANLGARWNEFVVSSAIVQHIGTLDSLATAELQRIWSALQNEFGTTAGTATIYHFGFEPGTDSPVRYTYRSTNGFSSERSEGPGFGVKPPPETFAPEAPDSLEGHIALAVRLKQENDNFLTETRIYIGGDLQQLILVDNQSITRRVHRFADYDETWALMNWRAQREAANFAQRGSA